MDMEHEILEVLKESPLLSSLTDRQAHQLAGIGKVLTFNPGERLVAEGSTGALALWVVVAGTVEVRKAGTTVTTLGRGAHIGEMAVLSPAETPRSADVVAADEVRALRIPKWELLAFIEGNPNVAMAVIAELARRLAETTASAADR